VTVPLSVDIERGYGETPAAVCDVVGALLDLGVAGINIEDGVDGHGGLHRPDILASRISALRTLASARGQDLFINARTDVWLTPASGDAWCQGLARARLYIEAGADGIFVPGLGEAPTLRRLADAIDRPLNAYAGFAGAPGVDALAACGVRRISVGCAPLQAALALMRHVATEAFEHGRFFQTHGAEMLSGAELNRLFQPVRLER
jgi:2-methylisocitrate lyase-like PEP mutase family enzyme